MKTGDLNKSIKRSRTNKPLVNPIHELDRVFLCPSVSILTQQKLIHPNNLEAYVSICSFLHSDAFFYRACISILEHPQEPMLSIKASP